MTDHTVDALARLGKYQVLDLALTQPAAEALCVVRFVTRHDGQVVDPPITNAAVVGASLADGVAVG